MTRCPECGGELVNVFDNYLACNDCDRFFSPDLSKVSTKGKWDPYDGGEG